MSASSWNVSDIVRFKGEGKSRRETGIRVGSIGSVLLVDEILGLSRQGVVKLFLTVALEIFSWQLDLFTRKEHTANCP